MNAAAVLEAALALPVADQRDIAVRLLDNLPPDSEMLSLDDPDLEAKLDARLADPGPRVTWDELRRAAEQRA